MVITKVIALINFSDKLIYKLTTKQHDVKLFFHLL